ncbi:MAG: hypothetical protein N0E48_12810, partial [Candidatus Thiodiazotropha endolucinida]|nr:hypothetical protein [Candidatus Thiodiazotropha taylori]MCW4344211.1 hypothetical protein [Candidatus Thiodiazotropha endolucinida]
MQTSHKWLCRLSALALPLMNAQASQSLNDVFLGIEWTLGRDDIAFVAGYRSAQIYDANKVKALQVSLSIRSDGQIDSLRSEVMNGTRNFQRFAGVGYSWPEESTFITGGLQAGYLFNRVDYLLEAEQPWRFRFGFNTLGEVYDHHVAPPDDLLKPLQVKPEDDSNDDEDDSTEHMIQPGLDARDDEDDSNDDEDDSTEHMIQPGLDARDDEDDSTEHMIQ